MRLVFFFFFFFLFIYLSDVHYINIKIEVITCHEWL